MIYSEKQQPATLGEMIETMECINSDAVKIYNGKAPLTIIYKKDVLVNK